MLANPYFNFDLMRKYTALVGSLFKDIVVERTDATGAVDQIIRVPLSWGPREKVLARLAADPNLDRPSAITLPVIGMEQTTISYDPSRHLNAAERILYEDPVTKTHRTQFNPVPYDFNYDINVYAKSYEDGTKIVEQVLPFFTPEFTPRVLLVEEMNLEMNVPVVMGPVRIQDNYADSAFKDRRAIVWGMSVTVRGYLYGPIQTPKLIKFVKVPLRVPPDDIGIEDATIFNSVAIDQVSVQPGLLANGSPTTNAAASVPFAQVNLEDDWAYATVVVGDTYAGEDTGGNTSPFP